MPKRVINIIAKKTKPNNPINEKIELEPEDRLQENLRIIRER